MAEVVRAGLQAIPKGQWEASAALGLGYWQTLRFVVLPQALRVTIPNILNSYVALFKDTTLVFFVGIFDFLKTIEVARADPKWATPVTSATATLSRRWSISVLLFDVALCRRRRTPASPSPIGAERPWP